MANIELASSYAALILADRNHDITPEKIIAITIAAGIEVEAVWATLLAKALEGKSVKELLANAGSGAAAAAPVEEKEVVVESEEESDDDFCFMVSFD
ncbi:hypothetical protein FRB95_002836 [Tulasnella sp. JGI-2019a]|nr:hypothetical protein FRB93_010940 [Tulasnella sp. JGI-2019a]KAG9031338.1 hypothetical protein FRB95_002836 [Tulasnella sp. JGI-2019a]